MKKKIAYFISVLLTCTCLNRNAQALWPDLTPLIPFSPQFCVMCIPPAIGMLYSTIDQVKNTKDRLTEMTDVTKIKQKFSSYTASLGNTALNYFTQKLSAKKKVAAASRAIMDSKREGVDVRKEDSIRADFINLFLQYPSDKSKIMHAYQQKGRDLKLDMALEMYITASEMYKDLCGEKGKGCEIVASQRDDPNALDSFNGDLKKSGSMLQLSMMESCLMEGKYCDKLGIESCEQSEDGESEGKKSESSEQPSESEGGNEDKVCHWKNALNVALAYKKIMRDNEYLVQMQNQYNAVLGIDTLARIKSAEEKQTDDGDASECQKCMEKNGGSATNCTSECK